MRERDDAVGRFLFPVVGCLLVARDECYDGLSGLIWRNCTAVQYHRLSPYRNIVNAVSELSGNGVIGWEYCLGYNHYG